MNNSQLSDNIIEKRFVDTLRSQGIRVTPQRLEVLRELINSSDHPSAEMVYQRVRQRLNTISRDTVYRTLNWLEESDFITRVGVLFGSARFESNREPHHHFLCKKCGLIQDVNSNEMDAMKQYCEKLDGYEVHTVRVELQGICPKCRKA